MFINSGDIYISTQIINLYLSYHGKCNVIIVHTLYNKIYVKTTRSVICDING